MRAVRVRAAPQPLVQPVDGLSLKPLFAGEIGARTKPLGFRFGAKSALVDDRYKIMTNALNRGGFELYDLQSDPHETKDLSATDPERFEAGFVWRVQPQVAERDVVERILVQANFISAFCDRENVKSQFPADVVSRKFADKFFSRHIANGEAIQCPHRTVMVTWREDR